MVYLDVTHIDREMLDRKLDGILEIYEKFVGDDPRDVPMKIFPGMHYTMGGLWVDFNQHDQHPRPLRRRRGRLSSTTAPTASAPTRSSPASTAASSPAPTPSPTPSPSPPRPEMEATPPSFSGKTKRTPPCSPTQAPKTPSSCGASSAKP